MLGGRLPRQDKAGVIRGGGGMADRGSPIRAFSDSSVHKHHIFIGMIVVDGGPVPCSLSLLTLPRLATDG